MNGQSTPPSHIAPGPGVVTSFTVSGNGNAGKKVAFFVIRDTTGPADPWTVVDRSPMFTLAGHATETFGGLHLRAARNDVIGLGAIDALSNCYGPGTPNYDGIFAAAATGSSPGDVVPADHAIYDSRLNLSATLEPDADGDGAGDETQDTCPTNAATAGPCAVDLTLTAAATPAAAPVGGTAVVAFSVQAGQDATGVVVHPVLPPGVTVVASYPACADACALGAIPAGATRSAILIVTASGAGAFGFSGSTVSDEPDVNAADNTASATVTFSAPLPALTCRVPSLKGLTRSFARRLLGAAHCRLGKTTKKKAKKGKRGTVIKQSKKPKAVMPVGSKVNITLRK
jgi:hypothetical protein